MFTKMQDFETLKNLYKKATDEIIKLNTKHNTIKAAPEKTFL